MEFFVVDTVSFLSTQSTANGSSGLNAFLKMEVTDRSRHDRYPNIYFFDQGNMLKPQKL